MIISNLTQIGHRLAPSGVASWRRAITDRERVPGPRYAD
jgi:hypothetical protein